jgi:DNA-binding transcriptional MerR regulator
MTSDKAAATQNGAAGLTTGQLAARVGITADAVRFYERQGLLLSPARTAASYRQFPASAVDRIRFIRTTQRLGLRLKEIRRLLLIQDERGCAREEARELLRARLAEVENAQVELELVRQELGSTLAQLDREKRS